MSVRGSGQHPVAPVEEALGRLAGGVVDASRARPRLTILLCVALTLASSWVAATQLEVDTDPDFMTSPDLPFRQTNASLRDAFPKLQNNFVVVVEGESGAAARAAVEDLASRLRQDSERYSYVFLPGDDPFYRDNGLFYLGQADLEGMAERIEQLGPLLASLAQQPRLETLLAAMGQLESQGDGRGGLGDDGARSLEAIASAVQAFNRGEPTPVDWEALLVDGVGDAPMNPQILSVQPTTDLSHLDPALESLADLRASARDVATQYGVEIRVTGDRAIHTEEMSLLLGEVTTAGILSFILVTSILFYALKSLRLMLATVLTLLAGLAWTAGFAGTVVGHLNMLTTTFAVLYIGLGVDFGIHFALGYLEGRDRGESPTEALRLTGRRVGSSLLFCTFSTAVGFFVFVPASYSGVAELGLISGTGIFLSLIATLTLYPALIGAGMGESEKLLAARLVRGQLSLPNFPVQHPRLICAGALLVTLAALATLPFVRFDKNPQSVRDPRVESVEALDDLLSDGEIPVWTVEYLVRDQDEAETLAARLEARPEIEETRTLSSFLPSEQTARIALFERMRGALTTPLLDRPPSSEGDALLALQQTLAHLAQPGAAAGPGGDRSEAALQRLRSALAAFAGKLEANDPEAAQRDLARLSDELFASLPGALSGLEAALPAHALELDDLPASLSQRYQSADGRARLEAFTSLDLRSSGGLEAFADAAQAVQTGAGGAVIANIELGRTIIRSLRRAFLSALAVITGLLLFLWRSPKYTLVTLTPLLIGSAMTAAFTVISGMSFNFANVVVLPLILGIGVDSGIHLVHRHRTGLIGADTILRTGTAQAVFYSAMTTVVSFSTLAFSSHLGIASFAQLLTLGIGLMLLANIVVLPAILEWMDGKS